MELRKAMLVHSKKFIFALLLTVILVGCYSKNLPDAANPRNDISENTASQNSRQNLTESPAEKEKTAIKTPSFRFIAMADSRGSDNGINSQIVKKTFERIKSLFPQPEFAVIAGDICDGAKSQDAVKKQLEYFKSIAVKYYPSEFFYPGIGNHEVLNSSGGEKAFAEVFSEFKASFLPDYGRTVYYFDKENTRIFMLNSNQPGETHKISDKQLDWIKTNTDTEKKHNLFFVHEPAFPTGAHVGSALDSYPLQRNKFLEVVDKAEGPMVFSGHEHNYSRRHIDSSFNQTVDNFRFVFTKNVYQIVTGSFGAPLYTKYTDTRGVDVAPVAQYHFAVVDVSSGKISVNVYNLDGDVLDSFEQSH